LNATSVIVVIFPPPTLNVFLPKAEAFHAGTVTNAEYVSPLNDTPNTFVYGFQLTLGSRPIPLDRATTGPQGAPLPSRRLAATVCT
jgi:hypothetical protein